MRLVVLAHDSFDPRRAKTAHCVIRYARLGWSGDEVVAVVDRTKAGEDASASIGEVGAGIPVVASVADACALPTAHRPDALVIGVAPVGGALPAGWADDIREALARGMRVVSGLHTPLKELFPEQADRIRDVRHEHPAKRIATGEGLGVESLVVTAIGTDCSSGKMTASVELAMEARRRGLRAGFVATGQTGIMIGADAGAPLDAIASDFVAGAMEECLLKAAEARPDVIFVEGQACLTHPAYAGVTASLLHGSFPDVLLLCDEPRREFLKLDGPVRFVKSSPARERALAEAHVAQHTRARVAAAALVTRGLSADEARAECETVEKELGVPAADVFREGGGRLLDGILAEARRRGLWNEKGFVRGAKSSRYQRGVV
jgi:uncharacterized NAD-dependent epimerase/dehydratase family protein